MGTKLGNKTIKSPTEERLLYIGQNLPRSHDQKTFPPSVIIDLLQLRLHMLFLDATQKIGRNCHNKLTSSLTVGARVVGKAVGNRVGLLVGSVGLGVVGLPVGLLVGRNSGYSK